MRKLEQVEPNAATLELGPELQNAHSLLTSEVAILLEAVAGQQNTTVFSKALTYAQTFSRYKSKELITTIRNSLANHNLHEFEMTQLGNLIPETADEAKSLIPSLGKSEHELQSILDDLSNTRRFQL